MLNIMAANIEINLTTVTTITVVAKETFVTKGSINQPSNQKGLLRAESGARARRRPLLRLTIPAYETHCWKW
jgi:hypothetical protein